MVRVFEKFHITSMKILFIGNINGIVFLNEHAKWLKEKLGPSTCIDIFSTVPLDKKKPSKSNYFNNKYFAYTNSILSRIPGFKRYVIMPIRFLLLPNDYDIIHIQYVSPFLKTVSPFFHFKAKKIIVTFWGSDFYSESDKTLRMIGKRILKKADLITMGNPGVITDFKKFFGHQFILPQLCVFGNDSIEIFKAMEQTPKVTSKTNFKLNPNKTTITIGYNPAENNQHLAILDAIEASELLSKLKDEIEFIIPFTYGGIKRYIQTVHSRLKKFPFNYKVIDTYLTMEELFHLRNASDIFIHLPISDSISGSLREYLFTKNIVITGKWLPYKILDQNEIYYHSIASTNQLPDVLLNCVENLETERLKCTSNLANIYKISSWKVVINDWVNLYNELLKN